MSEDVLREILGEVRGVKHEVGEMRQELRELKQDVAELSARVSNLENSYVEQKTSIMQLDIKMEQGFYGVVSMIDIAQKYIFDLQKTLGEDPQILEAHTEQLEMHNETINILSAKAVQQDAEINLLKRQKAISA